MKNQPAPEWREELNAAQIALREDIRTAAREAVAASKEAIAAYAVRADAEMRELREAIRAGDVKADKLLKSTRELQKSIGGFTESEGKILEIECMGALRKARKIGGIRIDCFHASVEKREDGKPRAEYDIVGEAREGVVVAEVKRTLRPEDVLDFAQKRLPAFVKHFPEYANGKAPVGAMIYKLAQPDAKAPKSKRDPVQLALDSGLILLQANAKNELTRITKAG